SWTVDPQPDGAQFQITWRETGVEDPDLVTRVNGFGLLVLKRIVAAALRGSSSWTARKGGIVWTLATPLSHVQV
ncbi:MAG: histidine kinase, partial [Pseudorhizobium sp.]